MKFFLFFCVASCLLALSCVAQDFVPESPGDCLDRFQSMVLNVGQHYAVVGSETRTCTDQPQLSKTYEWFVCENKGSSKTPRKCYSESRILYLHAPDSNVWEKRYISGSQLYRSFGDYLDGLAEVKKGDEQDESFLNKPSIGCPNPFANAILPHGGKAFENSNAFVRTLNMHVGFDERKDSDGLVGKFFGSNFVSEIRFSKTSGYMPTKAKTYFNTRNKPGAPEPNEYKILWNESETEWKKIGIDAWVPVRVTSVLHRINPKINPKSRNGMKIETTASWELKFEDTLLTDENVELLPTDGPIAELRTKLIDADKEKQQIRR